MSSKYAKLTKSELLIVIDQLETEATEMAALYEAEVESYRQHSLPVLFETIKTEAGHLAKDLAWLAGKIYTYGVKTREAFSQLVPAKAVAVEGVNNEFNY